MLCFSYVLYFEYRATVSRMPFTDNFCGGSGRWRSSFSPTAEVTPKFKMYIVGLYSYVLQYFSTCYLLTATRYISTEQESIVDGSIYRHVRVGLDGMESTTSFASQPVAAPLWRWNWNRNGNGNPSASQLCTSLWASSCPFAATSSTGFI
jgi:hypothetical protein